MAACACLDRHVGLGSAQQDRRGDTHLFPSQTPSQEPELKLCPRQAPRPARSFPSLLQDPQPQGAEGGGVSRPAHPPCVHVRLDTRVHMQVPRPRGLHGALPSAPGRATQMAPSTRLLPAALRLLFPGPSSKTRGGREEAWEGPPQLLRSPLTGRVHHSLWTFISRVQVTDAPLSGGWGANRPAAPAGRWSLSP